MKDFEIRILSLNWLSEEHPETDLCAHGTVYVRVGEEIVSDSNSGNWTVSSTALYLLRTLKHNYYRDLYGSQLLPCCGFTFFEDSKVKDRVVICGCPTGIDWSIDHVDANTIKHTTENGVSAIQQLDNFRKDVSDFVEQVEKFYQNNAGKKISDPDDRKAYSIFWKEWNRLKDHNNIDTGINITY